MKAYVFPGQGNQFVGMSKAEYNEHPFIRRIYNTASAVLSYNPCELMFDGPEDELRETRHAQVAIFLYGYILWQLYRPTLVDMVAGHSLGLYTALCAAEAIEFADCLRLVQSRALGMDAIAQRESGSMVAVIGQPASRIEQMCAEARAAGHEVYVANYNSPQQTIISGHVSAVIHIKTALRGMGTATIPLRVSGAFHTPLMSAMGSAFSSLVETAPIREPAIPVYSDLDGNILSDPERIREMLVRQVFSPVRWINTVQHMQRDGADEFIEVCHPEHPALQRLIQQITPTIPARCICSEVEETATW